jgi:hypothetical protein
MALAGSVLGLASRRVNEPNLAPADERAVFTSFGEGWTSAIKQYGLSVFLAPQQDRGAFSVDLDTDNDPRRVWVGIRPYCLAIEQIIQGATSQDQTDAEQQQQQMDSKVSHSNILLKDDRDQDSVKGPIYLPSTIEQILRKINQD